jgi:hypothetical protein
MYTDETQMSSRQKMMRYPRLSSLRDGEIMYRNVISQGGNNDY